MRTTAVAELPRVAFLAGTLGQGGAEKQLVYMALALHRVGVPVRVLCLGSGEHHAAALAARGIPPVPVGRHRSPPARLVAIAAALRR